MKFELSPHRDPAGLAREAASRPWAVEDSGPSGTARRKGRRREGLTAMLRCEADRPTVISLRERRGGRGHPPGLQTPWPVDIGARIPCRP